MKRANSITDAQKEICRHAYVVEQLSTNSIARELGIAQSTVWKILKELGVPLRDARKMSAIEIKKYQGMRWPPK